MKHQEILRGSRKGTIVLLPDVKGNIKQFRVSISFLLFLLCLMVTSASFLTWVILDYQCIKKRKLILVQAQKENKALYQEFLLKTEGAKYM